VEIKSDAKSQRQQWFIIINEANTRRDDDRHLYNLENISGGRAALLNARDIGDFNYDSV